jgi:adenine specific DNA methylase Mod
MASTNKQRCEDFKTQKPEELLQVLIEATSNSNDLIFDFFSGSGTTLATSHKSKRKWIGVEMSEI